jgi:prepilin-type processing-associated H-X9-DG protein
MSYGANASAGLPSTRGNPILITEAAKLGIFPENMDDASSVADLDYPRDHLGWALRFRHGGNANAKHRARLKGCDYTKGSLGGRPPKTGIGLPDVFEDAAYQPKSRLNAGFLDGHVERLGYWEVMHIDDTPQLRPMPKKVLWFGTRRRPDSIDLSP